MFCRMLSFCSKEEITRCGCVAVLYHSGVRTICRVSCQAEFAQWQREVRKVSLASQNHMLHCCCMSCQQEEQLQLQRDVADYHEACIRGVLLLIILSFHPFPQTPNCEALKERAKHVRASLQNTQALGRL